MAVNIRKIKYALLFLGLLLFAFMIHQIGLGRIADELSKIGFKAVFLLIPYALVHLLDTYGWRATLRNRGDDVKFSSLFMARLAGEAVNYLTPSAYLGGEPLKAYILKKHRVPLIEGIASVVTAKTMIVVTQTLFILLGIFLAYIVAPPGSSIIYSSTLVVVLITLILVGVLYAQHRGIFTGLLKLLEKVRLPHGFLKRREHHLKDLDNSIATFYRDDRKSFISSSLFFFLGWLVGSFEIYLLFQFLGEPVDLSMAITLESLVTVIRAVFFFIPGGLGALDGGIILLFGTFGFSPVTAMTFAIVRRVREMFWIGIGLSHLFKQEVGVIE